MKVNITYTSRLILVGDMGSGKTTTALQLLKGLKRVIWISPMGDVIQSLHHDWRVINDTTIDISPFLKAGNAHVVLDDMDNISTPWIFWENPSVKFLFTGARHRNMGYTVMTHRLVGIPKLAWKQAEYYIFFQTNFADDIKVIEREINPAIAPLVSKLNFNKHEKLIYDHYQHTYEVFV